MNVRTKKKHQTILITIFVLLVITLVTVGYFFARDSSAFDHNNTNSSQNSQHDPDLAGSLPSESDPVIPANAPVDSKGDWKLILVNGTTPLPEGFEANLTTMPDGGSFDKRAYPALQQMLDDARAAGLSPVICSAYRTQQKQDTLYQNKVNFYTAQGYSVEEAKPLAAHWVAPPGTSEHQTGLAADIVDKNYQMLDEKQEETPVQKWLIENCWRYGFILRYPTDKTAVTGIGYEPWHYRYVGLDVAKEITQRGICLEEYLGAV